MAVHRSAEPGTLVVRVCLEEREWLLRDAPETYYVTDYYRSYPVVLARLSRIDRDAVRDLLSVSWRLAMAKTRSAGGRAAFPSGIKTEGRRKEQESVDRMARFGEGSPIRITG